MYTVHTLQNSLVGGGDRGEGCQPSDLLCWLTVIWSGALSRFLGGGVYYRYLHSNDLGEGEGRS
jgi:hypothetical protein